LNLTLGHRDTLHKKKATTCVTSQERFDSDGCWLSLSPFSGWHDPFLTLWAQLYDAMRTSCPCCTFGHQPLPAGTSGMAVAYVQHAHHMGSGCPVIALTCPRHQGL